ncbi:unnamed protein product [Rhizoctonia solani]|uniref:Uncharacterized protein n=1 Tax=Rhizoctonia solani TaxID=456999 RepID=A0A8H2ZVB9_9AGAM|nr:unnamed protein product [Rhizoctonia solani]
MLPPGFNISLLVPHLVKAGYVVQATGTPVETSVSTLDQPAPKNPSLAPPEPRRTLRYTRDPNRPVIPLTWCPAPTEGTSGRREFNVRVLLRMSKPGFQLIWNGIKNMLIRDPEIDTDKAITFNDEDAIKRVIHQAAVVYDEFEVFRKQKFWPIKGIIHLILKGTSGKVNAKKLELKREEAKKRGEVVKKKARKTPTTVRERAKLKPIAEAKASTGPKVGSQPNTVFEGSPPTSSVIKLFKTHSTQVNHDNGTRDNDLDFGIMETSFHDEVLTQECAHEDDMGDITQNISVLAVGPDEEDESNEDTSNILGQLVPQAASTPSPAWQSISSNASPLAPAATACDPPPCKSLYPAPTSVPTASLTSVSSSAQGTIHTVPAHLPSPSPNDVVSQFALFVSTLPEASRALMSSELMQCLGILPLGPSNVSTAQSSSSTSAFNHIPPGLTQVDPTAFDDDDILSDAESASESNPPVIRIPSTLPGIESTTATNGRVISNTGKTGAGKGVSSNLDHNTTNSVGAKTAKAVRSAKGPNNIQVANATSQMDDDVTHASIKKPSTRANKGKGKSVAITADNEEKLTPTTMTRRSTRAQSNK